MGIQVDRIEKGIEAINFFNGTFGRGITRFTFSEEYMKAREYRPQPGIEIEGRTGLFICRG